MSAPRILEVSGGTRTWGIAVALRLLGLPFALTRFRGSTRVLAAVVRLVAAHQRCSLQLSPRSRIEVHLNDLRWVYLLFHGFVYEPSLAWCFRLFRDVTAVFIDAGASIGYWSALASENDRWRVVAVEPVRDTCAKLRRNRELNHSRFEVVEAALGSGPERRVRVAVDPVRHGSSYVVAPGASVEDGRFLQEADLVLADELVERLDPDGGLPVIVKLDVEGAEVAAIRGARGILEGREALLVYEDHGSDTEDTASRFVLEQRGLPCYWIDPCGRITPIRHPTQVRAIKRSRREGYNFFAAVEDSVFHHRLERHIDRA